MHSRSFRNDYRAHLGYRVPGKSNVVRHLKQCASRLGVVIPALLSGLIVFTSLASAQITFKQANSAVPQGTATIAATFTAAQTAGDMNIVAFGWDSGTITVSSVTDSSGNSYTPATTYSNSSLGIAQTIWYAANIKAAAGNTNKVTVKLSASTSYPDLRIVEYAGVTTLDKFVSAEGTSTTQSSGSVTTTQASELLFGADYTFGATNGAGSGYTQRVLSGDADNTEDKIVTMTGSYSATDSMTGGSGNYTVMQLATFYSAGATLVAPTLTATAASSSAINLSWTASSGATSYNVMRSTASAGTYTTIASTASTSYPDSGLSASTTYYYKVQAVGSGGATATSNVASATTSASSCTTAPSAPTGLAASGTTSTTTTISWTAVTPPTHCTISSYTVYESGSSLGSTSSTSFPVSSLQPSTTYTFTVEAFDADGNATSSPLNVTTPANTGQTYYVSKASGNNNNAGTSAAPWNTISYAASKAGSGDTVIVEQGTYPESVSITTSGVTFVGQGAIVDGTNVACCTSPAFVSGNSFVGGNTQGLFTIGASAGVNNVTVEGFTIQNYKTSTTNAPVGIMIVGGGTGIVISNNIVQNIQTSNKTTSAAAYGIAVFGTSASPLSVEVTGNTVTGCLTGQSETITFNGNVQNFSATKNTVYNNDNIGIDAIGYEGTGPSGSDRATNGVISGNIVYNNSAINNPSYKSYRGWNMDGLYCDGCTQVVFEGNLVYGNDIGIEVASETTSEYSSNVIIRNNLIYASNYAGISVGGYAQNNGPCSDGTIHCGEGGSQNVTIVNNTLYSNTQGYTTNYGVSAEFEIQYQTSNIVFDNNVVYAGSNGPLVNGFTTNEGVTLNYNDYYTTSSTPSFVFNNVSYTSFAAYAKPVSSNGSGQDLNSAFANPSFVTTPNCMATYPPTGGLTPSVSTATCSSLGNTDLASGSPALNKGTTGLGSPSGSTWSAYELSEPFVGSSDYNGNNRINAGQINIGAYEQ